jgi:4-hydroxy-2-oxoheptanedioate aldolase
MNEEQNKLRQRLAAGQIVLGLGNHYPCAGIVEGMCPGWDFVWVDGQHGQMAYDAMLHAMCAAHVADVDVMIRSPGHEAGILGPIADLDPAAIMVPLVETVAQARAIVGAVRFPPVGNRSYGGRRVIDRRGREYYRQQPLLVAQIESIESVANAPAIIATDGVDGLFFGPDDMKLRLGLPMETPHEEHPQLREAMQQTVAAARAAGKFAGTVTPTPAALKLARALGYLLLACGSDSAFVRGTAAQRLREMRALAGETTGTPTPAPTPARSAGLH